MKDFKKIISKPLTGEDMKKYIPNVMLYTDLLKMSDENIYKSLPIIILYETKPNYGHWTLLHKIPNGIEFFDSYGFRPDEQYKMISKKYQLPHKLKEFLIKMHDKMNIHYNDYMFQEIGPKINTCGRWCILRENVGGSIDDFAKKMSKLSIEKDMTPDELVSDMVSL